MIYRRIRDLREDHDKKQVEIASYLGVTQAAYSYYELGQREIPSEMLSQLADYYGTSVDYLLGRTDVKKPYPKAKYSVGDGK